MATPPRHKRTDLNWLRLRATRPATAEKEVPAPNPSMSMPEVEKSERRSLRVFEASECSGKRQAATPGRAALVISRYACSMKSLKLGSWIPSPSRKEGQ